MDLPGQPVNIRFDIQGLRMALSNLVSNAVKYTQEGEVAISLLQQDAAAIINIRDTGIGIPEDDIPRLFKEFFRAANARENQIPGTGVGLSVVKNIVERFGGEMALESRENDGSTFTLRLQVYEN